MKGIIGTSMQGRVYYKRPDKVKANCKTCEHCREYDKANDRVLCGKWNEWKYKQKRLCRWFSTIPQKAHGSTCQVNGVTVKFYNKNLHFHVYYRELPNGEWVYKGKYYAYNENKAILKAFASKRKHLPVGKGRQYEYKAEIHNEDIERIQTRGENNIPEIIWKKKVEVKNNEK